MNVPAKLSFHGYNLQNYQLQLNDYKQENNTNNTRIYDFKLPEETLAKFID